MHILLVSPHFPPRFIGGVEMYTKRLADALLAAGDRPAVVAVERITHDRSAVDVVRDASHGYPVYRLSGAIVEPDGRLGSAYRSEAIEGVIDGILQEERTDVLHLHSGYLLGGPTLAASRRRGVPSVVTLHDFWFICPRITLAHPDGTLCSGPESPAKCSWCLATERRRYAALGTMTGGAIHRFIGSVAGSPAVASALEWFPGVRAAARRQTALLEQLRGADLVLSPSRFLRDHVTRAGIPSDAITLSRYGIEMPPLLPQPPDRTLPLRFGFLGQVAPHKGLHILLEAFGRLRMDGVTLHIHGDVTREPDYVARLKQIAGNDQRVVFEGRYEHHQVYRILGQLDALIVPSVWYENAPFVIQEAQAARVPVIASGIGGMQELVSHDVDGLLFAAGNVDDLATQLLRLVREPALLNRLRPDPASVRKADDEVAELRAHYQRLASRRAGTRA